jgi:short-subunit dehydrogenase
LDIVYKKYGRIDNLVHNAAFTTASNGFIPEKNSFEKAMQINFLGPVELTRISLAKAETFHQPIKIVYISTMGTIVPDIQFSAYTAAKSAAENFFLSLDSELINKKSGSRAIIARAGLINSKYDVKIETSNQHVLGFAEALRKSSPTTSDDVVNKIFSLAKSNNPSPLNNVGLETKSASLLNGVLPAALYQSLIRQGNKMAQSYLAEKSCQSLFMTPVQKQSNNRWKKKVSLALLAGVGGTLAVSEDSRNTIDFFYNFLKQTLKRADQIQKNSDSVIADLNERNLLLPYRDTVGTSSCNGLYEGSMIMTGDFKSFMEHWNHALEIGKGSVHDQLYVDIVKNLNDMISNNDLMKKLSLEAVDHFQVTFKQGSMTKMVESIHVDQMGINVSENLRIYRRIKQPIFKNPFEEAMIDLNCDVDQISKFYNKMYNVNPDLKVQFILKKTSQFADQKIDMQTEKNKMAEFEDTFDYIIPGL